MKIPQATAASNGRDADLEVERRVGLVRREIDRTIHRVPKLALVS